MTKVKRDDLSRTARPNSTIPETEPTDAGLIEALFEQFESYLIGHGYQAQGGQILDATIIPVPKQHISKEEKEQLDQGEIPQDWQENPHRMSQRDLDATWTKKNNVSHFGYKDHINVDVEYGFIRNYSVTDAAVHNSIAALPTSWCKMFAMLQTSERWVTARIKSYGFIVKNEPAPNPSYE